MEDQTVYVSPAVLHELIARLDPFQTEQSQDEYMANGWEDDIERARR
jgi:hypothetical protein